MTQGALWDVRIEAVPRNRVIDVIKVVCEAIGLGLRDAKDLVLDAPRLVACGREREAAEAVAAALEGAGATITVSRCTGSHPL